MLKTPPSTRLDLLRPSIHNRVLCKQEGDKEHHDQRAVERSFIAEDYVWAMNFLGQPKWVAAVIENRLGPLTFALRLQDNIVWKRHHDHLGQLWLDHIPTQRSNGLQTIVNIYKPPPTRLTTTLLPSFGNQCIYAGYFKGALCRYWCVVNRLGDSGVKVVRIDSAILQLLLSRRVSYC